MAPQFPSHTLVCRESFAIIDPEAKRGAPKSSVLEFEIELGSGRQNLIFAVKTFSRKSFRNEKPNYARERFVSAATGDLVFLLYDTQCKGDWAMVNKGEERPDLNKHPIFAVAAGLQYTLEVHAHDPVIGAQLLSVRVGRGLAVRGFTVEPTCPPELFLPRPAPPAIPQPRVPPAMPQPRVSVKSRPKTLKPPRDLKLYRPKKERPIPPPSLPLPPLPPLPPALDCGLSPLEPQLDLGLLLGAMDDAHTHDSHFLPVASCSWAADDQPSFSPFDNPALEPSALWLPGWANDLPAPLADPLASPFPASFDIDPSFDFCDAPLT